MVALQGQVLTQEHSEFAVETFHQGLNLP
jgi:hypothetical protein